MNILDQLADHARERVDIAESNISRSDIRRMAEDMPKKSFEFEKALSGKGLSFICECKKASPSKGVIAEVVPYLEIARDYERAGADCISVLTEPKWFLGSDEYLREIVSAVSIFTNSCTSFRSLTPYSAISSFNLLLSFLAITKTSKISYFYFT